MTLAGAVAITLVLILVFNYLEHKRIRKAQESRDLEFKVLMLSLEEKAKKEGTFKRSFYD